MTENVNKEKGGALHHDSGKPPIGLIPYQSLVFESNGMEYGAIKYSRDDWRKGMTYSRIINSAIRHMYKMLDRENYDIENGVSHLGEAKASLGILAELMRTHKELDDRHEGVKRDNYTLEEIMQYREQQGLKTSPEMEVFIKRMIEESKANESTM